MNMKPMKRFALLLAAAVLAMTWTLPALAADTGADPLTLQELREWAASLEQAAETSTLYNDPSDPLYHTDEGYAFIYDFGTLYYSKPERTADAVLLEAVVYDEETAGPRGINTVMTLNDLLGSFYCENPSLTGSYTEAVVYFGDALPEALNWGLVQRNGQWVGSVEYAVHERVDENVYTDCGLVCTIQQGTVVAIRAYGLDQTITGDALEEARSVLLESLAHTEYAMVPTSEDGAALLPFDTEDLSFLGIDFLSCTPEDAIAALGTPDADDLAGTEERTMRTMSFRGCEFVFLSDESGKPVLTLVSIDDDTVEGPRALRVGDSLAMAGRRFRFGEGAFDEASGTEVLYGSEESGRWGVAEYGEDGSAVIRYGLTLPEGGKVVLMASFEMLELTNIMVYMAP